MQKIQTISTSQLGLSAGFDIENNIKSNANEEKYTDVNEYMDKNNLEIAFISEDKITFYQEKDNRKLIDVKTTIKDNKFYLLAGSEFEYLVWDEPTIDDYSPNINMIFEFLSRSINYVNARFGSNFKNMQDVFNGCNSTNLNEQRAAKYLLSYQLPPTLKLCIFQSMTRIIGYHQLTCLNKYDRQDLGLCERIRLASSSLSKLCDSLKTGIHGSVRLIGDTISISLNDSIVGLDTFKFGNEIELPVKDIADNSTKLQGILNNLIKDVLNSNRENTFVKELFSSYFKYDV